MFFFPHLWIQLSQPACPQGKSTKSLMIFKQITHWYSSQFTKSKSKPESSLSLTERGMNPSFWITGFSICDGFCFEYTKPIHRSRCSRRFTEDLFSFFRFVLVQKIYKRNCINEKIRKSLSSLLQLLLFFLFSSTSFNCCFMFQCGYNVPMLKRRCFSCASWERSWG